MTDFVVLTGFLGSGKTTLLGDFLALPEAAESAVIVNEAGEIGLDGAILAESTDFPIALLSNGCICCSLSGDLERTVAGLWAARARAGLAPARRIILETSGLAKPGPILRSLAALASLRMRLGVVATFDCTRGAAVASFEEAASQWAGAGLLVLTKRDMVAPSQLARARDAAAGVNPLAELIDADDRRAAVLAAFLSPRAPATSFPVAGPMHERIRVVSAELREAIPWPELAAFLDDLAGLCGERLLRTKGVVRVLESPSPILIQSVGTLFSAPRPFAAASDERSFLILILRDFDTAELASIAPDLPFTFKQMGRIAP